MAFTLATTLAENYPVISEHDPALDKDAPDFKAKWKQYRDGAIPEPPIKAGAVPTKFELRHISKREYQVTLHIGETRSPFEAFFIAAAYALVGATNLSDDQGEDVRFARELDKHELSRVRLDILDQLPPEVVLELGQIAYDSYRSQLSPLS